MAKDGTNRGGRRVRAGDKPAPAAEKKQKGLPVKIISNDIPALDTAKLEAVDLPEGAVLNGSDMPKPSDYLSARQKNGVPLGADDIYRETWVWLKQIAAGKSVIAFGDFSYYNIGDRGTCSFAELKELYAGNGMVGFVAKERVDGKLILPEAVQILKMKAGSGSSGG